MRADRLLGLLMLLQARGRMSASALGAELEVSPRTIYRDVEALSAAGVPVYSERGARGGIVLLAGYRTDMTGLTSAEAQALFAFTGRGAIDELGLGQSLGSALRKLLAALPSAHRPAAERSRQRVLVDSRSWFGRPESLAQLAPLQEAALADRQVRIRYQGRTRDQPRDYLLDPYGLVAQGGVWYLLASSSRGVRIFRVSRISAATVLDSAFERPADFDLQALWDASRQRLQPAETCHVAVRVRPDSVGLVQRTCAGQVHSPIRAEAGDDLDPRPMLHLEFGAPHEAQSALLRYAGRVEVVAPAPLRRDMAAAAADLAALYLDGQPDVG